MGDLQDTIGTALRGEMVTTTVEGLERYGVIVRYPRELRQDPQMALAYGPPTGYARLENDLARHCTYLASRYREAAENLALAKLHRRIAVESQ